MKHEHKPGCCCAHCQGDVGQQQSSARQLYAILNLQWVGTRAAATHAEFARMGIDDAFPEPARTSLGFLRERNPALLDNLLADILD